MTENTNPWSDDAPAEIPANKTTKKSKLVQPEPINARDPDYEYDIDGLMTDFPTAKELERFVFDETGIVLNLKGRANKLKYQVAMDALNGVPIDEKFVGNENPYLDKADMVPVEDLKPIPARDPSLPPKSELQNSFVSPFIPHPDTDFRARGKKVVGVFRKYKNNMISYEILGPLDQVPHGVKIDKYGRERPEIIKWVNPRTGEQLIQREDGTLTQIGRRLRTLMKSMRVNKSTHWDVWIDRDIGGIDNSAASNPWDLS